MPFIVVEMKLFFFRTLQGELAEAIKRDFGSYQNLVQQLSAQSVGIQGSGWGWLGYNKASNRLEIAACPNQDPLLATTGELNLNKFVS